MAKKTTKFLIVVEIIYEVIKLVAQKIRPLFDDEVNEND